MQKEGAVSLTAPSGRGALAPSPRGCHSRAASASDPLIYVKSLESSFVKFDSESSGSVVSQHVFAAFRDLMLASRSFPPGWSSQISGRLSKIISFICTNDALDSALRDLSRTDEGYLAARPSLFCRPGMLDAICPAEQVSVVWDLFILVREDRVMLAPETLRNLAARLESLGETDRALAALDYLGQNMWNLAECHRAITLLIARKPMDITRARKIAGDVGKSVVLVGPPDGGQGLYMKTSNEVEMATLEQKRAIWTHLAACVSNRKWKDVRERYETLRTNVEEEPVVSIVEVDNAMLDICKTYRKHNEAWEIYLGMAQLDSRTLPIMAAICHQGYLTASAVAAKDMNDGSHSDTEALEKASGEKLSWVARAWEVHQRYAERPDLHSYNNLRFLVHELLWITSFACQGTDQGLGKLNMLNEELVNATGSPIADEYLARPAIRLCWSSTEQRSADRIEDDDDAAMSPTRVKTQQHFAQAAERAFELYQRIRERVHHGKYKRIRRCDADVYRMMVQLCTRAKDIGKMAFMCQDVLDAKVELDEDLVDTIQTVGAPKEEEWLF